MSKDNQLLTSVAQSASYNIFFQFGFRALTFVINAILLRIITQDLLGVVNVRLALLYSTTLFIGREAFRKACLSKTEENVSLQEVINVAWCCPLIGTLAAAILSYVWMYVLDSPDVSLVSNYPLGVVCFALSAVLEMTTEPLFIIGQKLLYVRLKAIIEGSALLVKCLVTISIIRSFPSTSLTAFCIAQLAFTTIYVGSYYLYFGLTVYRRKEFPLKSVRQFFPKRSDGRFINTHLARLTWSFLKQSFLKQILTEGERYMMTVFNMLSFADQGVFDTISNLGSLVARFLFLPLEESSYLLFSQSITRGLPAVKQQQTDWKLATDVLTHLLKLVSIIALTILVFGYSYSQLALHIYGGTLLSSSTGPYLLKWYCFYVLTLAFNGITEGFSFATMSRSAVDRYNYKMLGFSVILLSSSYILTQQFGSAGFIMANSSNMLARIVHSVYIIRTFYEGSQQRPIAESVLHPLIFVVYFSILIITSLSEIYFGLAYPLSHILVGVACLLLLAGALYSQESTTLKFIYFKFIQPIIRKKKD